MLNQKRLTKDYLVQVLRQPYC